MISCKINGVTYSIADGFIFRDKYTEELDSGVITIPFSDKLDLSPFDFVELTDERFSTITLLIDTWTEDVVSFNPLKYTYNISLISETIKLQKVVMPNLGITQPINATQKSIYGKLKDYYDVYISKQYPELSISTKLSALTRKEICPENLFNRPTSFEVYNTLLGKVNSIVKVKNHEIDYIRLDQYGKPIDESKLYYVNDTQNIQEYANRLDIQVNNGISNRDNFSTINGITLRGGEGEAVMNDDNMAIVLDKPIYDFDTIAGVYVYFRYNYKNGESKGKSIANITDYIVEKSVYDTYLTSNTAGRIEGKNYKRNALYYVRGSNKIEGLNYNEKQLIGDSWIALYNILVNVTQNADPNVLPDFDESKIKENVFFKVEYKTSESYRTNVVKDNKYNATLIDNQTETQVDAENFGNVEQDKLNRLGNKTKIITATYMKDEIIPELGDYIGDYVLAEREIVYYDDYALFKGYLYKDYVRKNMFYGLNSRKRSTQIDTESVVRNDIVNYELSFELDKQEDNTYNELKRYILYPLALSDNGYVFENEFVYNEFPKYCFIRTFNVNGDILVKDGGFICLTPSTYASGKSNIIHFQFQDNFSSGIRLTDKVTGGRKQEYVKYVDDYGEFETIGFSFYSNKRKDFARIEEGAAILETIKPIADNLPLLTLEQANYISQNSNYLFGVANLELWKDNRETTALSINLNYKDSKNVIIGSFAENTGIAYHYISRSGVYICYSTTDEYEVGDNYGLGEMVTDGSVSIYYTDFMAFLQNQEEGFPIPSGTEFDNLQLYLRDVDTSKWKSWGIVEASTNRLILGVNKGEENTIPTKIYLKCTRKDY